MENLVEMEKQEQKEKPEQLSRTRKLTPAQVREEIFEKGDYKKDEPVKRADVHTIKNPAYVVKEVGSPGSEAGCIIECNEEFIKLTNFLPLDIDWAPCQELIQGLQEVHDKAGRLVLLKEDEGDKDPRRITIPLCQVTCRYRLFSRKKGAPEPEPQVINNVWIYSKDQHDNPIRRKVDIRVFPYKVNGNRYALHILIDRGEAHSITYFKERFRETSDSGSSFKPASTHPPERKRKSTPTDRGEFPELTEIC